MARHKRTKHGSLSHTAQKATRPSVSEKVTFPEPETGAKPLKNMRIDRAALLVAQDEFPDEQIALVSDVWRSTLAVWKKQPAFQQRVAYLKEQIAATALQDVIEEARARTAGQDSAVRQFYAEAAQRRSLSQEEAIREAQERACRNITSRSHSRPAYAPAVIVDAPVKQPRTPFEKFCYGEEREPMCLSNDIMHQHSTR